MIQDQHNSTDIKLLFCCAGLGMGNASRIVAIIEELIKLKKSDINFQITVLTWGAGFDFFHQYIKYSHINIKLIPLSPYLNWHHYLPNYFANSWKIYRETNRLNYHLVVIDSDYHFIPYIIKRLKCISISQAADVIFRSQVHQYQPKNIIEKITFFIREKLDATLQSFFANKVLIPCFHPQNSQTNPNEIRIPLIVRKEFLKNHNESIAPDTIGVLLSGSGIEKEKFLNLKNQFNITIISPERNKEDFICHANELDKFQIIFTQGGLSSISEAIAKEKFVVVFPIKNHPEQILNALEVEKSGRGLMANINQLEQFDKFKKILLEKMQVAKPINIECNGAEIAANIIYSEITFSKTNN